MENQKLFSLNKAINIAFAYVGIITGAGLATGRELVQYFISFGFSGILGAIVMAILFMLFGKWILALGSFYQSDSHMDVFSDTSYSWVAKLLDASLTFACFVMSFVMIAGAGSNFAEQFGTPTWVGALICSLMILGVSYMDFNKVTAALGIFTPIIIVMLLIGLASVALGPDVQWMAMFEYAETLPTTLPNIGFSVINYLAMNMMIGTSMLFVLGGNIVGIKNAERGGILGGFFVGVISLITAILIYSKIDVIGNASIPMLTFMNEIHPIIGMIMFFVIFGMIFNTGFSVCYSLGKRLAGDNERKFKKLMPIIVLVSFALSFVGFSDLVAIMYPLLGYIGMVLLLTIAIAWFGSREEIAKESGLRAKLFRLMVKRRDSAQDFTKKDSKRMDKLLDESVSENEEIKQDMAAIVERRHDWPDEFTEE